MAIVESADIRGTQTAFTMVGAPLLASGQTMQLLARSPRLWAHCKVYASGGENGLHSHANEDHLFFVVSGQATFRDSAGTATVLDRFDGMLIPAGNQYCFESSGDENLVMLRVGTTDDAELAACDATYGDMTLPAAMLTRYNADGTRSLAGDGKNGTGSTPGVPLPGRAFGRL